MLAAWSEMYRRRCTPKLLLVSFLLTSVGLSQLFRRAGLAPRRYQLGRPPDLAGRRAGLHRLLQAFKCLNCEFRLQSPQLSRCRAGSVSKYVCEPVMHFSALATQIIALALLGSRPSVRSLQTMQLLQNALRQLALHDQGRICVLLKVRPKLLEIEGSN
jgi:hypothetical protein